MISLVGSIAATAIGGQLLNRASLAQQHPRTLGIVLGEQHQFLLPVAEEPPHAGRHWPDGAAIRGKFQLRPIQRPESKMTTDTTGSSRHNAPATATNTINSSKSHQHGDWARGPQPASADEGMNRRTVAAAGRIHARRLNIGIASFPLSLPRPVPLVTIAVSASLTGNGPMTSRLRISPFSTTSVSPASAPLGRFSVNPQRKILCGEAPFCLTGLPARL